jgi:hypothetical protein
LFLRLRLPLLRGHPPVRWSPRLLRASSPRYGLSWSLRRLQPQLRSSSRLRWPHRQFTLPLRLWFCTRTSRALPSSHPPSSSRSLLRLLLCRRLRRSPRPSPRPRRLRRPPPQLRPLALPHLPSNKTRHPRRKSTRQSSLLKSRLHPTASQFLSRRVAAIPTPHRLPQPCLRAAWLCPRPARAPFTRRRLLFQLPPSREPATRLLAREFNAASPSSTATGLPAVQAAIPNAPQAALLRLPANSRAAPAPNIQPALRQAVMPELVLLALPAHVQALPRAQDLDHHGRVALAALHVQAGPRRQPERPRAQRARLQEAAAVARSIPRPKKAR